MHYGTWNESLFNSICNRLKMLNFCAKNFTACLMCTLLLNTDTIQWHIHLCWRGKSATGKTTRDRCVVDVPLWWSSTWRWPCRTILKAIETQSKFHNNFLIQHYVIWLSWYPFVGRVKRGRAISRKTQNTWTQFLQAWKR